MSASIMETGKLPRRYGVELQDCLNRLVAQKVMIEATFLHRTRPLQGIGIFTLLLDGKNSHVLLFDVNEAVYMITRTLI
jgi:hypothetical protein